MTQKWIGVAVVTGILVVFCLALPLWNNDSAAGYALLLAWELIVHFLFVCTQKTTWYLPPIAWALCIIPTYIYSFHLLSHGYLMNASLHFILTVFFFWAPIVLLSLLMGALWLLLRS